MNTTIKLRIPISKPDKKSVHECTNHLIFETYFETGGDILETMVKITNHKTGFKEEVGLYWLSNAITKTIQKIDKKYNINKEIKSDMFNEYINNKE